MASSMFTVSVNLVEMLFQFPYEMKLEKCRKNLHEADLLENML